jgi:hypothetical protein
MKKCSAIFALFLSACGVDATDDQGQVNSTPDWQLPEKRPETWIVGRPVVDSLLLTASKSGRELFTLDQWGDEDSIEQTESLAVAEEIPKDPEPFPFTLSSKLGLQISDDQPISIELIKFKSNIDPIPILEKWQAQGRIQYYEPNGIYQPQDSILGSVAKVYAAKTDYIWHNMIRLNEALVQLSDGTIPHGNENTILSRVPVIAVLDSGVDIEHPKLKNSIWKNPAPGILCKDDLQGCNTSGDFRKDYLGDGQYWPVGTEGFNQDCPSEVKNCNHGTHVAGIISAYDGKDPIGVCPYCKILPLRVSSDKKKDGLGGGISDSAIIRALQYITQFSRDGENLIRIANGSFGKYQRSRSVATLIRKLAYLPSGGVLFVAAASNEDSSQRAYPAAVTEVISVAALDNQYKKADFSNFGPTVDIAAPGVAINSTVPGGTTEPEQGTSMASPVVAGVAGLILTFIPTLTTEELRDRIINSANPTIYSPDSAQGVNGTWYYPKLATGDRIPMLGSGVVDTVAAIKGELHPVPTSTATARVSPGCSQIKVEHQIDKSLLILLLIPVFMLIPKKSS